MRKDYHDVKYENRNLSELKKMPMRLRLSESIGFAALCRLHLHLLY